MTHLDLNSVDVDGALRESAEEAGHFADTVALSEKVRADICFNNATRLSGLS